MCIPLTLKSVFGRFQLKSIKKAGSLFVIVTDCI